ncbi:hypothetical protein CG709_09495, partial [Lachnotalea glycerini]
TIQNDSMEMEAANRLCTDNSHKVYMNSTKSLTGHCLGAAGAVEIIATVLAVYHDVVFGTYNLDECDNNYETLVIQKENSKNIKANAMIFWHNSINCQLTRYESINSLNYPFYSMVRFATPIFFNKILGLHDEKQQVLFNGHITRTYAP